ncbi:hypothetical protein B7463_g9644, partial [Scytalidium lignicola]
MSLRLGIRSSWRLLSLGTGVTRRHISRAIDPPFPTVPTCPSPTCACAATPEMPQGLEIDHKRPLNGTMAAYSEQVLICTGKDDWPSRIEEENSGDNLAADIKELLGKGGIYSDPFHNVAITNSSFPSSLPPRGEVLTTSAYILPSFKYVPFLPRVSFDSVQALVKGYLLPTKLSPAHNALSPIHKDRLLRSSSYQNILYGVQDVNDILVLICGHGGRDMRCGITGPLLRSEFERMLPMKDVQVLHNPVKIPLPSEEKEISGPETVKSARTARVGVISHIGGHKFAGNVILYIPPTMKTASGATHSLAGCGICVRRSELFNTSRSVSPAGSNSSSNEHRGIDPEIELQLQRRLASIYGDIEVDNGPISDATENNLNEEGVEEEDVFEFRLFGTSKGETSLKNEPKPVQKIVLNDKEELGDGGFVGQRDIGFYIQEKATGYRRREIEAIAVSGEDVLQVKKKRYFGWEVPWRVTVLRDFSSKSEAVLKRQSVRDLVEGKRKKPGKKRRILLRVRMKKKAEIQEKKRAEMEAKEASLKEKKTRRNREKKVKRKMKEKAKKIAASGDPSGGNAGVEDGGEVDIEDRESSSE